MLLFAIKSTAGPMDLPDQKGLLVRHTSMPKRLQKTPHGDVFLHSRWNRDHYLLLATGRPEALRWLLPRHTGPFENRGAGNSRVAFVPSPKRITVERELRQACSVWQEHWNEMLDALETSEPVTSDPLITTIGELFIRLFKTREQTLRSTTIERDRYHLGLWRRELGENTHLARLTEVALVGARARIAAATSAATANDGFNIVKTYLTWAFNQGLMSTLFFKSIRKLKIPPKDRRERAWWTSPEVELALTCARQDAQATTAVLYVAIGCFLGLRPEEAIMLRWEDIDLDAVDPITKARCPVAHITPHDGWMPKDGEARAIPICDRLFDILSEFRRADGYLLEAEVKRTKRKPNAPWAYRYDPKKIWKRVNDRVVAAGGKAITAYGMRHTFASNLLIANVPDFKVSKWLGHADARMLHRHYGHLRSYDSDINAGSVPRPNQQSARTGA